MKVKIDGLEFEYEQIDKTEKLTHKTDEFEVSLIFKNDENLHRKSMETLEEFFIRTDL